MKPRGQVLVPIARNPVVTWNQNSEITLGNDFQRASIDEDFAYIQNNLEIKLGRI